MKLKYFFITFSCFILASCGSNIKIDPENEKSKRLEILPQVAITKYENSWNNRIPEEYNIDQWVSSDGAQSLYYPENVKIAENLNSKKVLNIKAEFHKLDESVSIPVISQSTIYVKDKDALISAYNLQSGSKIWSRYASDDKNKNKFVGGGLFKDQNKIYCSFGGNEILALDAENGEEIWRSKLSSVIRATPVYGYGKIFVRSLDNKFFVLNAQNGELLYIIDAGIESLVRASKAVPVFADNQTIILPNSSGIISLMNQNSGENIWSENIAFYENPSKSLAMNDIAMTPVIKNGLVYVASQIGNLSALEVATGHFRWSNTINGVETIWIVGDSLFAIDDLNELWHFNALNGLVRWKANLVNLLGKEYKKSGQFFGPIMANGKLLISSSFGKLLQISAKDGSLISTVEIPVGKSSIPIVIDKQVIILSANGKLTILSSK